MRNVWVHNEIFKNMNFSETLVGFLTLILQEISETPGDLSKNLLFFYSH